MTNTGRNFSNKKLAEKEKQQKHTEKKEANKGIENGANTMNSEHITLRIHDLILLLLKFI